VALSVCLLLDERADRAVRALWLRLEDAGVGSLLSHTHGRHRPHLTLTSLLAATSGTLPDLLDGLAPCRDADALTLRFDALGMFRRSRCWLVPEASRSLLDRQEQVAAIAATTDALLHRNYAAGAWTPHLTLAPRLHLDRLSVVARLAFDVLPVDATLGPLVVVDTTTGEVHAV
jgi:2'-5' RNA ligase